MTSGTKKSNNPPIDESPRSSARNARITATAIRELFALHRRGSRASSALPVLSSGTLVELPPLFSRLAAEMAYYSRSKPLVILDCGFQIADLGLSAV